MESLVRRLSFHMLRTAMRTASPLVLATFCAALTCAGVSRAEVLSAQSSARTAGMGGAGVAASHGAASLHYNPALVAYEETLGAELSVQAQYDFASLGPAVSFALAVPLGKQWAVGIASAPGWNLEPRQRLAGRPSPASATPYRTYDLSVAAMWAPDPQLGIALAAGLTRGTVAVQTPEWIAEASSWGALVRASAAFRSADERWTVGALFQLTSAQGPRGELQGGGLREAFDASIPVVHQGAAGVDYRWSKAVSTTLQLELFGAAALSGLEARSPSTTIPLVSTAPNVLRARLGTELALTDHFRLRLGVSGDLGVGAAERDAGGPALPRIAGHAGVGYTSGFFEFDFGATAGFPDGSNPRLAAVAAAGFRI